MLLLDAAFTLIFISRNKKSKIIFSTFKILGASKLKFSCYGYKTNHHHRLLLFVWIL